MNPAQYEALRAQVAEAVGRAIPVDPDDGTVYLGSKDGVPLWGHPSNVIQAAVAEVMQVVAPAPLPGDPANRLAASLGGDRWGCGCAVGACRIRWDIYRDASADPYQALRGTCITHGLVADSEEARCADSPGVRQRAMVMAKLDLLHQEQCR